MFAVHGTLALQLVDARNAVSFELESLEMQPDPEPLLVEMIHAVSQLGIRFYI